LLLAARLKARPFKNGIMPVARPFKTASCRWRGLSKRYRAGGAPFQERHHAGGAAFQERHHAGGAAFQNGSMPVVRPFKTALRQGQVLQNQFMSTAVPSN
jgi:hypothetical protein